MCAAISTFRILILVNVRWWNANAFYAVNLARILARHGHRVWVGCGSRTPASAKARSWGLPVADLDFSARNPLRLAASFRRLACLIRSQKIQIINSHRPEDSTFGWLAQHLTGVGHVVTRGDQRPIGNGWPGRLRYHQADAVVLTCRSLLERNRRVLQPILDKTTVIYGSADERRFGPPSTVASSASCLQVGWVGRLDPVKDPLTFLRAAAWVAQRNANVHFVMAGSPANLDRELMADVVRKLGIESRLTLLPRVADIATRIAGMDLGVISSTGSEVISRVLLEFLAWGKPVLGSAVNAIGEIIRPGINGDLFPPGDHQTLGRLILAWANDPQKRRRYSAGAGQAYRRNYAEGQVYRQFRQVLTKIWPQVAHRIATPAVIHPGSRPSP